MKLKILGLIIFSPLLSFCFSGGTYIIDPSFETAFQLDSSDKEALDLIAESINKPPLFRIELQGHSDSKECNIDDTILSYQRCKVVQEYLTPKCPYINFKTKALGGSSPKATNSSEEGRARNRRVEFHLLGSPEPFQIFTKTPKNNSTNTFESISKNFIDEIKPVISNDTNQILIHVTIHENLDSILPLIQQNFNTGKYILPVDDNDPNSKRRRDILENSYKLVDQKELFLIGLFKEFYPSRHLFITKEPVSNSNRIEIKMYKMED